MPLIDPDEPRYASTARDMVLNGNWIVPHFNGVPRINKPPLFYWAIAISYKLFGINEFSARLPSALAATGTVLITYLWGKKACRPQKWILGRHGIDGQSVVLSHLPLLYHRYDADFFVCSSLYFSLSNIWNPTIGVRGV